MHTLNLGILAHVDAGKTSLTERLLFAAGVIDEVGSVDHGSTQTDSLALERQRGITIKSAVVSFVVDGVTVNLIDTPGHPDFIAEVERVLSVLDGAVLVVSAVEGVQPQARILMRALQRLRVPTLMFVNKIDRRGADPGRVFRALSERLTPAVVSMGDVHEPGTRDVDFTPAGDEDADFRGRLAEVLAENNESILGAYVDGEPGASYQRLRAELAAQTGAMLVHPVFFGSALTGAGVPSLVDGIAELLPTAVGDVDGPVAGHVFKVERGPAGEKIAYIRMFSGSLRTRERVRFGCDREGKLTAITVFDAGTTVRRGSVSAGQIGQLWGLTEIQVGDSVGTAPRPADLHQFAPPSLESVVVPCIPSDRGALRVALAQLAEQDPLINVRQDDRRGEISISLYGEIQKEVIGATLATEFGVDVGFRETTTICLERPVGTGAAIERLHQAPNPFLATVGLRIEPAAVGSGVEFHLEAELGSMPLAFFRAVEDTVRETLQQGLYGWGVTDCTVAMTHSGYLGKHSLGHQRFNKSLSSTGEDFRKLTPLVLMAALRQATTVVCEPIDRFRLDAPADTLGSLLPALTRLGALPKTRMTVGAASTVTGDIPAARVHELRQQLPTLSGGEGVLECELDRYDPVRGAFPTRPRSDCNPLNREEYLQCLAGRAGGMAKGPWNTFS
ncbi:MAG: ribosomal protection tetracycline resistance protein [Nocardioidaceae bacterium]|nr:ribosomal protection tetracycline resistance protein [Nocardioidaceae bacterium]